MELEQMWQSALGEIQVQLSRSNYITWIKGSRLVDRKEGTCYIAVPNNFTRQWIEEKYQKNLLGILRNLDGSVKRIEFLIGENVPAFKANDGAWRNLIVRPSASL